MNIAFVYNHLGNGGAEKAIATLSSFFTKNHNSFIFLHRKCAEEYPVSPDVKKIYLAGPLGSNVYVRRICQKFFSGIFLLINSHKLRKVCKKNNIDVLISFYFREAQIACKAVKGTKIKHVQSIRNNPWKNPDRESQRKIRDMTIPECDFIVFQTKKQKEYFHSIPIKQSNIIYNTIDDSFFKLNHQYNQIKNFVTLGRLEIQKNHKLLLSTWKELPNSLTLTIYGDGPLKETLEKTIADYNLKDRVFIKKHTNDVKTVLNDSDAFILSSDFEGMPNALIEAMASGLPCISTDCQTGPAELIEHNSNGILVPVNDVAEMKDAVLSLINNPSKARTMGINARASIQNKCGQDTVINQWYEVFEQLFS